MKKIISLFVTALFLLSCVAFSMEGEQIFEEKIECNANVEDEFSDSHIIVVLNNNVSRQLNDYDKSFFQNIDCKSVKDLTAETKEIYKKIGKGNFDFIESEFDSRKNLTIEKFHQILLIELNSIGKQRVLEEITKLEEYDEIIYAGPDYYMSLCTNPNDSLYITQSSTYLNHQLVSMPDAWSCVTSSNDIVIGVIDSGINSSHEDLTGNMYNMYHSDFTSGTRVSVTNPIDTKGHGTEVAGVIAAKGNNQIGVAGVCWNANLVSLRVVEDSTVYTSYVISAIDYATSVNISILNVSLASCQINAPFNSSYAYAIANYGGLFVCAAGNNANNNDINNVYPSDYLVDNRISVGSCCYTNDTVLPNSNYGATTVDLFAPGYDVAVPCLPSQTTTGLIYYCDSGTSLAAPYVSGVAALMLSVNPTLTPKQIKKLIIDNVDTNSSYYNMCVSNGRLNAYKAVKAASETKIFKGDVNGDDKEDVVVINKSGYFYNFNTLLGNTSGTYSAPVFTNSYTFFYNNYQIFMGDFNGDNRSDILIHQPYSSTRMINIFLGKSDGTFEDSTYLVSNQTYNPLTNPSKFFVCDQDGDGKDDFVVFYEGNSHNRCALVYKGTESSPYIQEASTTALSSNDLYRYNDSVFTGDFNGDGKDDLLINSTYEQSGTIYRRIYIYKATTTGYNSATYLDSCRTYYPYNNPSKFYVSNINNDSYDDFVVIFKNSNGKNVMLTYLGTSSSPYITDATTYSCSSNDEYNEYDPIALGDFDGDGKKDIVIGSQYGVYIQLILYKGASDGSFSNQNYTLIYIPNMVNASNLLFLSSDIDGDGQMDLIIRKRNDSNNTIILYIYEYVSNDFSNVSIASTSIPYYNIS